MPACHHMPYLETEECLCHLLPANTAHYPTTSTIPPPWVLPQQALGRRSGGTFLLSHPGGRSANLPVCQPLDHLPAVLLEWGIGGSATPCHTCYTVAFFCLPALALPPIYTCTGTNRRAAAFAQTPLPAIAQHALYLPTTPCLEILFNLLEGLEQDYHHYTCWWRAVYAQPYLQMGSMYANYPT